MFSFYIPDGVGNSSSSYAFLEVLHPSEEIPHLPSTHQYRITTE